MSTTTPSRSTPEKSHGGGPRTEAGKAVSSQNALKFGLFATRDFIRPEEQSIYNELAESLQNELAPEGVLEQTLADEIRRATWRLRRCAQIDEGFSTSEEDPMLRESAASLQLSVDRARSQAHRILHKCTAELRKLQTEREYRSRHRDPVTDELRLGLCDLRAVRRQAEQHRRFEFYSERIAAEAAMDAVIVARAAASSGPASSFCTGRPTLVPTRNFNHGPK
jgi:hypothetical protein